MFRRDRSAFSYSAKGGSARAVFMRSLGGQLSAISLVLLCACFAYAEDSGLKGPSFDGIGESGIKEPIIVNGDSVEYYHEKKEVIGTGNISINYKDVVLTCNKITVDLNTKTGIAEGNVKVKQKDSFFTGEKIKYNFATKEASVMDGFVSTKPFFGRANDVNKVANRDEYKLKRGYITTCDNDKPHYRVQARRVEIYPGDKVTAKHILFFIGDVPVFYFPYYSQSLKDTKTHINVIPGNDDTWGYYALGSLRYNFADQRGDILVDYRSKLGLAGGINHYYKIKDLGEGAVKVYYTRENNRTVFEKTGRKRLRYRYQVRHEWEIGGPESGTTATFNFDKLSDPDIIKDYFENEYDEMGEPNNYASFLTAKSGYSTELLFVKRFDNFFTVVERLPEFKIDIPNTRIGNTMLYYDANASGVYLNRTFDKTVDANIKDDRMARFDVYNKLSYAASFFRTLNVTPYFSTEQTYYSRNKWGDTNDIRTVFNAGVDTSIKFYRLFNVSTNFMNLDINKLRHIITPTMGYYFTHQPTISSENLVQFDEIDARGEQSTYAFSLENRLQTKRHEGDSLKSVDLATFIISTNYTARLKKRSLAVNSGKEDKFSAPVLTLELYPYSFAWLKGTMTVNPKTYAVMTNSIDATISGGNASLDIGYRYEKTALEVRNLLNWCINYKLNDKWRMRLYQRFNPYKGSGAFEEHEITVYRDLHCWTLEFTYRSKPYMDTKDSSFWFVMRCKAFPETPIGYQRVYSRDRFGAIGANDSVAAGN